MHAQYLTHLTDPEALDTDTDDYYDDSTRQYNALPVDPYQFDEVLDILDNN